MSKVTMTLDPYKSEKLLDLQLQAVGAISKELVLSGRAGSGYGYIEVVRVSFATWAPKFNHLYINMVLSDGKKEEKSVVFDPQVEKVEDYVMSWVKETVKKYLRQKCDEAITLATSLKKKLEILSPASRPTA